MDREQLLNNLEMSVRTAFLGFQSTLWTSLPCIVRSVNFSQMTVNAQPTVQGFKINEDGSKTFINYPVLEDIPIVFPSAGGFTITFPIQPGDEILVVLSARCIDFWWQSGQIQNSIETRMNDLSDSFAIPGVKSLPNIIPGISNSGVQIRNNDGTTYIEISADGKIKLISPSEISIQGDVNVTGSIQASGEITSGSIPLSTHKHTGVTTGGGTSGGPTP